MPKKPKQTLTVDGRELAVSNLDKVYFPECGFTKGEVLGFYLHVAGVLLPHLEGRPLTMKRYPEGVAGEHFYEKNAPVHTPDWVPRFPVPREEGGAPSPRILCNDRATLLWVVNLGDIEKHVILARAPRLNEPTSIVFDLDPGEPAGVVECARVALHLKEMLEAWNLETFVKVSGSKGLHLSVPLNSGTPYEQARPFAKAIAELAAQRLPGEVVSGMSKAVRRGKVFIDWSQNTDFKTTVSVYSMRARRGEPFISLPVTWAEIRKAVKTKSDRALFFTPAAALQRMEKLGDLHERVLTLRQTLPSAFTQALEAR
ncbi:MAG TPA: non-homologous end-joining DNA ligase [Chthoniobacteraceae bacterium]|jgi:bifunctional non-homologous end joining protein LigD|nr:non-homologous end-joining DNA ligase [Chthoniobacteraceae bacterium]